MDWGISINQQIIDTAILMAVAAALYVVCIFYNRLVATLNGKNDDMHYVGPEVVVGVFGVLAAGVIIIGLIPILKLFILFAAAGLPMIWGYVDRHYRKLMQDHELMRQLTEANLRDGDES